MKNDVARIIFGWPPVVGISVLILLSDSRWTAWLHIFNWLTGLVLIALFGLSPFHLKMETKRS